MYDMNTQACYPYIYQLRVASENATYLDSVQPSAGDSLSPYQRLELTVTFSGPIFYQGTQVTPVNAAVITNSFVLKNDHDSSTIRANSSIANNNGASWTLYFNPPFNPTYTYTLVLQPGLKDQQGRDVVQLDTNPYSMADVSCSNRGTFFPSGCLCNEGYAGEECEQCDLQFDNIYHTTPPTCIRRTGPNCWIDTCSCDPTTGNATYGVCEPLGTCDDGKCTCSHPFTGDKCQECISGYTNWEKGCIKSRVCNCVRGTCDEKTQTCKCPDHWAGDTCEECATGWGGNDCSVKNKEAGGDNGGISPGAQAARVFGGVLAGLLLLATVLVLVYRKWAAKRNGPYGQLQLGLVEDVDDESSGAMPLSPSDD